MRPTLDLLRNEAAARRFLLAHAQSSLGTGAAYVALVVVAYERFRSPWAIALVLLAEFLPGMLLGPVLGAAADRWSRRGCAITADVVRAAAFLALPFVDGVAATVAVAAVAGAGNALYRPAALAALPGMVEERRLPAATAVFSALTDLGYTVGPALAAAAMLVVDGGEAVLFLNALSFAVSALLLGSIRFGAAPAGAAAGAGARQSLLRATVEGMRAAASRAGIRVLIAAPAALVLFAGLFNVGELLLAERELGAGGAGYSVLVAVFGASVALGSLAGSRGGSPEELTRRYLAGFLLVGLGIVAAAFAPSLPVAAIDFAVAGFGNGLVLVHERILLQRIVPDAVMGRVFGLKETLEATAWSVSFVAAGAIATVISTRELFLIAGGGALLVWATTTVALRRAIRRDPFPGAAVAEPAVPGGAPAASPAPS